MKNNLHMTLNNSNQSLVFVACSSGSLLCVCVGLFVLLTKKGFYSLQLFCGVMVMYKRSCERPEQMSLTGWKWNNQARGLTAATASASGGPLSSISLTLPMSSEMVTSQVIIIWTLTAEMNQTAKGRLDPDKEQFLFFFFFVCFFVLQLSLSTSKFMQIYFWKAPDFYARSTAFFFFF